MRGLSRPSRALSFLVALSVAGALGSPVLASSAGTTDAPSRAKPGSKAARYVEADRWLTDGRPHAIAVAPDGSVVVTQAIDDKVSRFDRRGKLLGTFELATDYPYGVGVDSNGQVHVTQYSGFDSTAQVHIYSTAGQFLASYGVPESASTQFSPWGMDFHSDQTAFIANAVGDDVQLVRPDGSWGGRLGGPGSGPGQFDGPRDVALGNGSVYVVDTGNRRVQRFDPATGELQAVWGQSGYGKGQFANPQSIDVAPDGRVLVLDRNGPEDAVLNEFTPKGSFLGRTTLPLTDAFALAAGDAGTVYVTGHVSYPKGGWGVLKVVRSDGSSSASKARVKSKCIDATARRHHAPVKVACSAGPTRCSGTITVARDGKRLAQGRYGVAAGRTTTVTLQLTKRARVLLRAQSSVAVRVRLKATSGRGGTTQTTLTR